MIGHISKLQVWPKEAVVVFSLISALLSSSQASGAIIQVPNATMKDRATECQTKHLEFNPHGPHEYYWAWVANFEVNGQDKTTSCVMLFKSGQVKPVGSAQVMCVAEPAGSVTFKDGKATFRGGHLRCDIDLVKLLPAIEKGLVVDKFYDYNDILIAAAGTVGAGQRSASNPVVIYKSKEQQTDDFGMYLPMSRNSVNLKGLMNGTVVSNSKPQAKSSATTLWMIHYVPEGETQAQVNLLAGKNRLTLSKPVPSLRLHMNGGTFYVGGSPKDSHFTGTLDEVVVDPYDGGRPPNSSPGP